MPAMDPRPEADLDELLDTLLQLDREARLPWLDAHRHDAALRSEALRILAAAEAPGVVDRVRERLVGADGLPAESCIAEYRLLRKLGAGGMATVYLAERRVGPATQCVALKLMRSGLYDDTQQALFRREQRILANLEHPGIARLIDAGLTPADVPYLVMEFVDGVALDSYCDSHSLALGARLRLFLQVCDAVAYAHRNLIVHRDLKPSNILVTAEGTPKLLDFGIAKILLESEDATRTEVRRLTPGYAAPEQASGAPITTATDVYALGVILHELLTGVRPVRRSDGTLARPSSAIAPARTRDRRLLRGDLDSIVLRALHVDPDRRYADAREFAADVTRHLDGRPVQARPDGWTYHAARFLKRNRVAATAAAIIGVVLIAAALVSLREADLARAEAARAIRTKNFLVGVFEELNPVETKANEPPSVKDFLRSTIDKARTELRDIPDAQTEIVLSAADTLRQLGEVDESGKIVDRMLADVRQRKVGGLALAHALNMHSYLRFTQGDLDAAAEAGSESLSLYEAQGVSNTSRVLEASQPRAILADVARQRGDYARAMQLHGQIIDETRAKYGDSMQLARRLQFSVIPYIDVGRLDDAERIQREAMAMAQRWRGANHRVPMQMRRMLADILMRQGKFAEAEAELREWLDYQRRTMGEKDPQIADTFRSMAELYRMTGRAAEAAGALDEAERIYGPAQTARLIDISTARGHVALLNGDAAQAQAAYERARRDAAAFYGPRHRTVATALVGSGVAQARQGKIDVALAAIREAIAMLESQPTPLPAPLASAYGSLADVLIETGNDMAEARDAARKALEFRRRVGAPAHPDTAKAEERVRLVEAAGA